MPHNDPTPQITPSSTPQTPQPLFQPIIFLTTKTANETFEAKMEPQYQAPEISLPKKTVQKLGVPKVKLQIILERYQSCWDIQYKTLTKQPFRSFQQKTT